MSALYTSFCPKCDQFEVNDKRTQPTCKGCGWLWRSVSDYWIELDEWEARHKMKITDYRVAVETDTRDYMASGQLEKDINVLIATTKLNAATEITHKILDIMEKEGHQNPEQALNEVAIQLGFIVADAHKEEMAAKKDAGNE